MLGNNGARGNRQLQFVETDVILYPNGQASVKYTVRYRVLSGDFHGFYFGGLDRLSAYFDTNTAFGIGPEGKKYKLDIKNLGDKYDIVLANGRLSVRGKFHTSSVLARACATPGTWRTRGIVEGNDLMVFNWAPAEWDEPMGHYTVKIVYPREYDGVARPTGRVSSGNSRS